MLQTHTIEITGTVIHLYLRKVLILFISFSIFISMPSFFSMTGLEKSDLLIQVIAY
jgi:hypothetical protein